jgi:ribosomal protein L40E
MDLLEKRAAVRDRVAAALGDETICHRCGANYRTYALKCTADLGERCPGFNRVDEVQVPIERDVFGL